MIEVLWDEGNIRSYKKLLPVVDGRSLGPIVTFDDDVLYDRDWLLELWKAHKNLPRATVGTRGSLMRSTAGRMDDYVTWARAVPGFASRAVFLTGVGGILYPPGFPPEDFRDRDLVSRLCPTADDVWFKAASLHCNLLSVVVSAQEMFLSNRKRTGDGLWLDNVAGANDAQLRAVFAHFQLGVTEFSTSDVGCTNEDGC